MLCPASTSKAPLEQFNCCSWNTRDNVCCDKLAERLHVCSLIGSRKPQNKHHGEQLPEVYFKNFEGERPAKAALVLSAMREAVSRRKRFQVPLCFRKSPPTSAYLRIEPYTRDWWLFYTVRTKLFTTLAVNVRKSCFSEETLKHAVGTEVHELRWIKFTTNSYLSNLMYTWTVSPSES